MTEKTMHEGRNVKRIREILGVKQEALASDLGLTQQAVSALEQKEALDKDMLEKIAAILKVPAEAVKNFDEEKANNFFNSFHDKSQFNYQCNFNPLDKYVEAMEENKKLYERLLETEKEKVEILKGIIDNK